MSKPSKIMMYNLEEFMLENITVYNDDPVKLTELVNNELKARGIDDTLSMWTVVRFYEKYNKSILPDDNSIESQILWELQTLRPLVHSLMKKLIDRMADNQSVQINDIKVLTALLTQCRSIIIEYNKIMGTTPSGKQIPQSNTFSDFLKEEFDD